MKLMMRGKTWHLRRRVPARFGSVEPRCEVWVSLKTDSRQQAAKKAPAIWESLVAGWPDRTWITRMSVLTSNRYVAKLWRDLCKVAGYLIPAICLAEVKARFS